MSTSTYGTTVQLSDAVVAWLVAGLPEAQPPFRLEPITGGYSMLTSRLIDESGRTWVLRQPPPGQSSGRAHDPARESRTMAALWDTPVPVPRVRMTGTADDPLGTPCHVTDYVDGPVLTDKADAERLLDSDSMRVATTNLTTVLAALHAVDPEQIGLSDLGPAENYNGRQVHRWNSTLERLRETDAPDVAGRVTALRVIGDELGTRLPADTSGRIVHGDYRLGNTITGTDGAIHAVLDWELVTRGEPLADLGLLLTYWDAPAESMLGASSPTTARGSLTPDEVVSTYVDASGRDVSALPIYRALACWRLSCMSLRTAARVGAGAMGTDSDPSPFLHTCDVWAEFAGEQLRG